MGTRKNHKSNKSKRKTRSRKQKGGNSDLDRVKQETKTMDQNGINEELLEWIEYTPPDYDIIEYLVKEKVLM